MKPPKRYAEGTSVPADKSRAEVEALLRAHGASEFALRWDSAGTTIVYRMRERMVRHVVAMPNPDAIRRARKGHVSASQLQSLCDAEWRRRWRATLLILKGRLEQVASGESTFEKEFLADTVLANGETVAEAMLPRIAQSYASGEMPSLLLGPGGT